MDDQVIKDAAAVVVTAEELIKEVTEFVRDNIIKVDVKFTEGSMLKQARLLVADGLRNLAKAVEDPSKKIKLIEFKKE